MLLAGINDSEESLRELALVLEQVRPDELHINLPTRPPCEPWVQPADDEALMRAVAIFGRLARVIQPVAGDFDLSGFDDVVDAVLAVITRHPMRDGELRQTLDRWSPGEVNEALDDLRHSGRAQVVERFGERFWSAAGARYVDSSFGRCYGDEEPESKP